MPVNKLGNWSIGLASFLRASSGSRVEIPIGRGTSRGDFPHPVAPAAVNVVLLSGR